MPVEPRFVHELERASFFDEMSRQYGQRGSMFRVGQRLPLGRLAGVFFTAATSRAGSGKVTTRFLK
jgi:hypothetical protein